LLAKNAFFASKHEEIRVEKVYSNISSGRCLDIFIFSVILGLQNEKKSKEVKKFCIKREGRALELNQKNIDGLRRYLRNLKLAILPRLTPEVVALMTDSGISNGFRPLRLAYILNQALYIHLFTGNQPLCRSISLCSILNGQGHLPFQSLRFDESDPKQIVFQMKNGGDPMMVTYTTAF
jgi:hypothetical protein